jgi:hypothetical protein
VLQPRSITDLELISFVTCKSNKRSIEVFGAKEKQWTPEN